MTTQQNEDRLKEAFEYVRKTFFPKWDKKGEWKVVDCTQEKESVDKEENEFRESLGIRHLMEEAGLLGGCFDYARLIEIYEIPEDTDSLHALLIHEICHAEGANGHGKKWAENMNKAYSKCWKDNSISIDLMVFIECDIAEMYVDEMYDDENRTS